MNIFPPTTVIILHNIPHCILQQCPCSEALVVCVVLKSKYVKYLINLQLLMASEPFFVDGLTYRNSRHVAYNYPEINDITENVMYNMLNIPPTEFLT
jgi:hypothetical protein